MDSNSQAEMHQDMDQLKALTRKRVGSRNRLEDLLIEFSGANKVIAKVLPENEKSILLRIGGLNIGFCLIALVGIGYIFFLFLESWVAVIFLLVVAALFSYCLKTAVSASLLHLKKQHGLLLFLKRVFLALCLLVSLAALAMWIFASRIDRLAKYPYYEQEYREYRNTLSATESADTVGGLNDKYSYIGDKNRYTVADYLASVQGKNDLLGINELLNNKQREITAMLPLYYARINHDDSAGLQSLWTGNKERYLDLLPVTLPATGKNEARSQNGLPGIVFTTDSIGNVHLLQNNYDSIFIAKMQLDSIRATQRILNYLIGNYKEKKPVAEKADYDFFYQKYFIDLPLISADFLRIRSDTRTWLQKQVVIDNQVISPMDKIGGLASFLSLNESSVIFVVMMLIFFGVFMYQVIKGNFKELRESRYPVLVGLYQNLEATRLESIEEGLADSQSVPSVSQVAAEEKIKKQVKTSIEQIRQFGTVGYYMQSGQVLETAGDYNGALEKYAKGYEMFPDEYEFLKRRSDVFFKKEDNNQGLEYLKLYNDKRNSVTVENNLKRNFSLSFFRMHNHPFYGDLNWPLNRQMNILLGKNGYGKSHLLSILLALVQNDIEKTKEFTPARSGTSDSEGSGQNQKVSEAPAEVAEKNPGAVVLAINQKNQDQIHKKETDDLVVTLSGDGPVPLTAEQKELLQATPEGGQRETLEETFKDAYHRISFSAAGLTSLPGKIPVLAIADARFIDKSPNLLSRSPEHIDIRLDSAKHFLYQKPYGGVIENALYRVCQLYMERSVSSGKMVVIELIEGIFQELTGSRFELKKISSRENTEYEILVSTEGAETLPLQKVSQGTFSVISIVIVIYNYLRARYPSVSDQEVTSQQAIVFIDEVDAHLHPAWQQKIVNIFMRTFPAVQFFMTAHSPLVVAGRRSGEVAVLRKAQKGFTLDFFENDFIGYQPEELFRAIFEMETYDETYLKYNALLPFKEKYVREINILKAKERRNAEEERHLNNMYNDLYYMNVVAERSEEIRRQNEMKRGTDESSPV